MPSSIGCPTDPHATQPAKRRVAREAPGGRCEAVPDTAGCSQSAGDPVDEIQRGEDSSVHDPIDEPQIGIGPALSERPDLALPSMQSRIASFSVELVLHPPDGRLDEAHASLAECG